MSEIRICSLVAGLAVLAGAAVAAADPVLSLQVASPTLRYYPGDAVIVTLQMSDLPAPASGFQAFVEFDPAELTFIAASYTGAPFGQPIITPIADEGGNIDLAAGINIPAGQTPTAADATLVVMAFQANQVGCIGSVQFRTHAPPARFTDGDAQSIGPVTLVGLPAEPLPCGCACEFDGNAHVNVFDLLMYLDLWFAHDAQAELDGTPGIDVFDLLAYLDCWFPASAGGPCP